MERTALPPGATIGVLGGGQLGRMLGLAARAMGYRIAILDPDPACPARGVADRQVVARYDDLAGAVELAEGCAVVTYELEHVDAGVVEAIARRVPVRPGLVALRATQDRLAERRFLDGVGVAVSPWREVRDLGQLRRAAAELGYPLRVKVPFGGYDGRSQVRVESPTELEAAALAFGWGDGAPDRSAHRSRQPLLVEAEVPFEAELSVVCARAVDGRTVAFPVAHNIHDAGILFESVAPAAIDPLVAAEAQALAAKIAGALDLVGTLTVELFLLPGGALAVNELAPRVHNSGHYTIEACRTSQFEQHIRAICGLPLGSPEQLTPAAMVNLLGTGPLRPAHLLGLDDALADPRVHVHVYDKRSVFERRKMGHVTVSSETIDDALVRARRALTRLSWAEETTAEPEEQPA